MKDEESYGLLVNDSIKIQKNIYIQRSSLASMHNSLSLHDIFYG